MSRVEATLLEQLHEYLLRGPPEGKSDFVGTLVVVLYGTRGLTQLLLSNGVGHVVVNTMQSLPTSGLDSYYGQWEHFLQALDNLFADSDAKMQALTQASANLGQCLLFPGFSFVTRRPRCPD